MRPCVGEWVYRVLQYLDRGQATLSNKKDVGKLGDICDLQNYCMLMAGRSDSSCGYDTVVQEARAQLALTPGQD